MASVKLNVEELKNFLKHIIENNKIIQEEGKIPTAVNVEGEAGLGKTSAIIQLGEELNMDVVKLNLSQIEELGDLVGFPYKEFEMKHKDNNAVKWVQETVMATYLKSGYRSTGESRMSHAAPEWIQGKTEGGFLILDDYTRADHRFMQATMELIDRQQYISWKLPKNWHIVLTTNPDDGNYNVTTLDIAQKTRFITTEVKFDEQVWARWAEMCSIDGRCINFLLMHPELVTNSNGVNPRSITTFFNAISSIKEFEKELPIIQMIGEGSVGDEFASMFSSFINNKLDKIITPKEAVTNPDLQHVYSELNDAIGSGDDFRADISSLLITRIINYCLKHASENPVTDTLIERLVKFATDCPSFTDDLKYYMIKEILNGNKTKYAKLMLHKDVVKMSIK